MITYPRATERQEAPLLKSCCQDLPSEDDARKMAVPEEELEEMPR